MLGPVSVNSTKYQDGVQQALDDVGSVGFATARDQFNASRPVGYKPQSLEDYHYDKGYSDGLVKCLWDKSCWPEQNLTAVAA